MQLAAGLAWLRILPLEESKPGEPYARVCGLAFIIAKLHAPWHVLSMAAGNAVVECRLRCLVWMSLDNGHNVIK